MVSRRSPRRPLGIHDLLGRRCAKGHGARSQRARKAALQLVAMCASRSLRILFVSNLELDPDLHDLRAGDLEIGAWPLGVVMHEGEDRLAPARQAWSPPGRDDRFVAGIVDRLGRDRISGFCPRAIASSTPSGTLGCSMKPKRNSARVTPSRSARPRAFVLGRSRRLCRRHRNEEHIFIEDVIALDVVRERERHTLGHPAEDDRRPRNAVWRVLLRRSTNSSSAREPPAESCPSPPRPCARSA